jgi:hypothetical protein
VNKSVPIALTSIFTRGRRRPPDAPEGAAASGKALGEVALLSPDEVHSRLLRPVKRVCCSVRQTWSGLTPR